LLCKRKQAPVTSLEMRQIKYLNTDNYGKYGTGFKVETWNVNQLTVIN